MKRPRQKPDDGLRPLITAHLRSIKGSIVHWVPIESSLTQTGIGDLYGRHVEKSFWIECKATSGWALSTLTEFQVGWILSEIRAGGPVFIFTRRRCVEGPRRAAADELWVHRGEDAPALKAAGLEGAVPLFITHGGHMNWQWNEIGRVLLR